MAKNKYNNSLVENLDYLLDKIDQTLHKRILLYCHIRN